MTVLRSRLSQTYDKTKHTTTESKNFIYGPLASRASDDRYPIRVQAVRQACSHQLLSAQQLSVWFVKASLPLYPTSYILVV